MSRIILILFVTILILAVGCDISEPDETVASPPLGQNDEFKDPDSDDYVGFEGITKQRCVNAGGNWNECGSPCAGTDANSCIQVCQVQCECGGIAGFTCPEGFKCRLSGKIADEMGICVKG